MALVVVLAGSSATNLEINGRVELAAAAAAAAAALLSATTAATATIATTTAATTIATWADSEEAFELRAGLANLHEVHAQRARRWAATPVG